MTNLFNPRDHQKLKDNVIQNYQDFAQDLLEDLNDGYESDYLSEGFLTELKRSLKKIKSHHPTSFHIFWAHYIEQLVTIVQLHEELDESDDHDEKQELHEEIFDFWDGHEYSIIFVDLLNKHDQDTLKASTTLIPLLENQIIGFFHVQFEDKFISDRPVLYSTSNEMGDGQDRFHLNQFKSCLKINPEKMDNLLPISRIDHKQQVIEFQVEDDVFIKSIEPSAHQMIALDENHEVMILARDEKTQTRLEEFSKRTRDALKLIKEASPQSYVTFTSFSNVIIPIDEPGIVSYSLQSLPGVSFINMFERDFIDLVDDLLHENGHHYLNTYLNHIELINEDNEQIYYSPWRRALRPIRGLYHAVFTFYWALKLFRDIGKSEILKTLPQTEQGKVILRACEEFAMLTVCQTQIEHAYSDEKINPEGYQLIGIIFNEISNLKNDIVEFETKLQQSYPQEFSALAELKKEITENARQYQWLN